MHIHTIFKSISLLTPLPPPPPLLMIIAVALLHLFESQTTLFDADNLTI